MGIIPLFFISCGHVTNESELKETVDSFATTYYNWQFQKTVMYCTPESEKWLCYAASNVHQADIDMLRSQDEGASHEINDIKAINDSTATAFVTIHNFLRMDTIGKAGQMVKDANVTLSLKYRKERWMVHLNSLPYISRKNLTLKR
jgi:hypothetical protein